MPLLLMSEWFSAAPHPELQELCQKAIEFAKFPRLRDLDTVNSSPRASSDPFPQTSHFPFARGTCHYVLLHAARPEGSGPDENPSQNYLTVSSLVYTLRAFLFPRSH